MGKLNLANYRPQDDSSSGTDEVRTTVGEGAGVIIRQTSDHCLCGCNLPPAGKASKFRMGHDARYRGILIRAHCTATPVTTVRDGNRAETVVVTKPAMSWAEEQGWETYLKIAKEREELRDAERAERASARLLREATGPQVGDRRLIKVGRWAYTGQVVAVFEDGDQVEFQYITSRGSRRVMNPTILPGEPTDGQE